MHPPRTLPSLKLGIRTPTHLPPLSCRYSLVQKRIFLYHFMLTRTAYLFQPAVFIKSLGYVQLNPTAINSEFIQVKYAKRKYRSAPDDPENRDPAHNLRFSSNSDGWEIDIDHYTIPQNTKSSDVLSDTDMASLPSVDEVQSTNASGCRPIFGFLLIQLSNLQLEFQQSHRSFDTSILVAGSDIFTTWKDIHARQYGAREIVMWKDEVWNVRRLSNVGNNPGNGRNSEVVRRPNNGRNEYRGNDYQNRQGNQWFESRNRFQNDDRRFNDTPGLTHVLYHEIDTGDNPPVVFRPYRYDRVKQEILDYHVDKMLKEGIIPIQSPYVSPVVLCRKNLLPPDNPEAYRFAVAYRKLNAITKYPRYPLPLIDDLIMNIPHTGIMSALDLRSEYFQMAVNRE
ncbi:retrovirus-related Pol polyprotein from transposon 17.6 [Trichonephila clavipes]|nr:retrovirus-related Pol polyprotein from transposon 17.6 [Trichonephila clavipes]